MSQMFPGKMSTQVHHLNNKQNANHRNLHLAFATRVCRTWGLWLSNQTLESPEQPSGVTCDEGHRNKNSLLIQVLNSTHPSGNVLGMFCVCVYSQVYLSSPFIFTHTHTSWYVSLMSFWKAWTGSQQMITSGLRTDVPKGLYTEICGWKK